jgi:molecular chaperone Hsp33
MTIPADDSAAEGPTDVELRVYFVRKRNALLVRGVFSDLFMDYYLHCADLKVQLTPELDAMMKEALVSFTMHLASRPWSERHAWTVNFQTPLANFFVTGDNQGARVAGRCFTENVRVADRGMFHAVVQKANEPLRQSAIDFSGASFFGAVEEFYARSEQRRARFFEHSEEDYVFLSAQPQCDTAWLESLTAEDVRRLDQTEELSLLEQRKYHWECGCSPEKLYAALMPQVSGGLDAFFEGAEVLRAMCPRCGRRYNIDREQFEAWIAERA